MEHIVQIILPTPSRRWPEWQECGRPTHAYGGAYSHQFRLPHWLSPALARLFAESRAKSVQISAPRDIPLDGHPLFSSIAIAGHVGASWRETPRVEDGLRRIVGAVVPSGEIILKPAGPDMLVPLRLRIGDTGSLDGLPAILSKPQRLFESVWDALNKALVEEFRRIEEDAKKKQATCRAQEAPATAPAA